MDWKNRIISYGQVSPYEIAANASNYRKHPTAQRRALQAAIEEVGYVQPIVVNQRTNNIVDGHLRVDLAKEQKISKVPVIYIDVSLDEEKKLLSTIDPITNMAVIDQQIFGELMTAVSSESQIINDMWESMRKEQAQPFSYTPQFPPPVQEPTNTTINQTFNGANPYDIYTGMPEYTHEDKGSYRDIIIHFGSEEDVQKFSALIGQHITDKTRYLWIPQLIRVEFTTFGYEDSYNDEQS
jgi:hypothetical protein